MVIEIKRLFPSSATNMFPISSVTIATGWLNLIGSTESPNDPMIDTRDPNNAYCID